MAHAEYSIQKCKELVAKIPTLDRDGWMRLLREHLKKLDSAAVATKFSDPTRLDQTNQRFKRGNDLEFNFPTKKKIEDFDECDWLILTVRTERRDDEDGEFFTVVYTRWVHDEGWEVNDFLALLLMTRRGMPWQGMPDAQWFTWSSSSEGDSYNLDFFMWAVREISEALVGKTLD